MRKASNRTILRTAHRGDEAGIRELVFGQAGPRLWPEGEASDLDDIEAHYAARGGYFAVLEGSNGAIHGSIGVFPIDRRACALRRMALAPELRSSGLGRIVLELSLLRAKELGFERVFLESASVFKELLPLYPSLGFEPTTHERFAYVLALRRFEALARGEITARAESLPHAAHA